MKVLVACEYSGVVRDAFIRAGHDAMSCDLLPSESDLGKHYQTDIFDMDFRKFDLMIAHPPCTYLTNAGAKHLYKDGKKDNGKDSQRWRSMYDAVAFFNKIWIKPVKKKCFENPIMVGHAKEFLEAGEQTQVVQPWMFGHPEKKAICLWLEGLKPLEETDNVYEHMLTLSKKEQNRIHYMSPGKDRQKERSRFYTGIAQAMAEQWG